MRLWRMNIVGVVSLGLSAPAWCDCQGNGDGNTNIVFVNPAYAARHPGLDFGSGCARLDTVAPELRELSYSEKVRTVFLLPQDDVGMKKLKVNGQAVARREGSPWYSAAVSGDSVLIKVIDLAGNRTAYQIDVATLRERPRMDYWTLLQFKVNLPPPQGAHPYDETGPSQVEVPDSDPPVIDGIFRDGWKIVVRASDRRGVRDAVISNQYMMEKAGTWGTYEAEMPQQDIVEVTVLDWSENTTSKTIRLADLPPLREEAM